MVFHSVVCGLWIAPHNCNNTFTPPFTTDHTYKLKPVRKQNSNILKLLNALHQVVLHFFTCLTTALLIGKVNSYCFEDFAHHLTLLSLSLSLSLSLTHTHTHTHKFKFKFNHRHQDCRGEETCPLCAGGHKLRECTAPAAHYKCINCVTFNRYTKGEKISECHLSLDKICPSLQAVLTKYRLNTDY